MGDAASGAPHGAERTAEPTRAASESQIAWGTAGAFAGASTVGLLATSPAGPWLGSREYAPFEASDP